MREESQRWIQIKDDIEEPECNNELYYLRSQRFCQRNSRMCRQCCPVCETHGDERLKNEHVRLKLEDFNNQFQKLQATCNRETEHYIRQMNEAEQNAVKMIAKKKQEYLQQIQEVKAHMMKKTYRSLEQKFPQLYQKYKNQRLDTLKCCEVFWVMTTPPSNHLLKHSQINKKLESILRKFQTFREVSKNLPTENIFNDKVKGKKMKLSEKLNAMAEVPRQAPVIIEKPNYNTEYERNFNSKIEELRSQIKKLNEQKRQQQLSLRQIENNIRRQLMKTQNLKPKLKIFVKTININIRDNRENKMQIQNQTQKKILRLEPLNIIQTAAVKIRLNQPQANPKTNIQPVIEATHIQKNVVNDKNHNEKISSQQNDKIVQLKQAQSNVLDVEDDDKNIISKQNNLSLLLQNTIPQQRPIQAEVKLQAHDNEPFVQWNNTELVDQIKKYGNKFQTGLKVQEIDRLKTFSYVKLSQNIGKISSSLLKKAQNSAQKDKYSTPEKKKPNDFILMAQKLFQKLEQSKKNTDKQLKAD